MTVPASNNLVLPPGSEAGPAAHREGATASVAPKHALVGAQGQYSLKSWRDASGKPRERILQAYPYLEPEDIDAALAYAAWRLEEREEPLVMP